MVAYPLGRPCGAGRRITSHVVVGALGATTAAAAGHRWGCGRAVMGAAVVSAATAVVERIGTTTGLPFGRYQYTGRLRPAVAGVPVIVPLAWWSMALPAREAAHAALGPRSTLAGRVVLGALALTAWDLFLDPQMTAEGYWRWRRGGAYRGVPLSNFAGWLLTGAGVTAALEVLLPAVRPDRTLVGAYAAMGMMETVGFAAFFRDRVVAAAGGAAMLPIAALALVRFGDG